MQRALAIAVDMSRDSKIGVSSATYTPQSSCPPSCSFFKNGCYGEYGPTGIHTKRLNTAAVDATPMEIAEAEAHAITAKISGLRDLRLHVVGDCATDAAASLVSDAALSVMRKRRKVWSYTHAWRTVDRASWGAVSVLASTEKITQAIEALDKGWAPAIVVPSFQSEHAYKKDGLLIMPCVHTTRGVQCADCGLCKDAERLRSKGMAIAFTPHGSGKKRVLKVLDS